MKRKRGKHQLKYTNGNIVIQAGDDSLHGGVYVEKCVGNSVVEYFQTHARKTNLTPIGMEATPISIDEVASTFNALVADVENGGE
jgi:hypothetical protein